MARSECSGAIPVPDLEGVLDRDRAEKGSASSSDDSVHQKLVCPAMLLFWGGYSLVRVLAVVRVGSVILRRSLRIKSTILRVSTSVGAVQNAQDDSVSNSTLVPRTTKNGFSRFADARDPNAGRTDRATFGPPAPPQTLPFSTCATPHDHLPRLGPFPAGLRMLGAPRTPRGDTPQRPPRRLA
eukprot:4554180-Prymnesium_polylepis.1